MASKPPQLLLSTLLLFLTLVLSASSGRRSTMAIGAWKPVPSLDDPQVVEIAKFAVSEFDKKYKLKLTYQKVVKGEFQTVSGNNYQLTITTTAPRGSGLAKCEAVVWDKP